MDNFLKDLLFCFSIDRHDPLFPKPPTSEPGECPIKAWLKYIMREEEGSKKVSKIMELTTSLKYFRAQKNMKIWLIINQANVFQRGNTIFSLPGYNQFKEYLRAVIFQLYLAKKLWKSL